MKLKRKLYIYPLAVLLVIIAWLLYPIFLLGYLALKINKKIKKQIIKWGFEE